MSSDKYPHLGFDPAPGDLETVRLLVAAVGKVSRDGGTAQTQLSKIGSSDGIWVGKSADAFADSVSKIPPYLKKALDSLGDAHRALVSWETALDGFQARARKLEEEASAAAKKAGSAKSSLTSLPDDTSGMSDTELEKHKEDKKSKQKASDTADAELEDVRSRAHTLNVEYNTSAGDAARIVRSAADDAPPEPNWFDDLVDGVQDFLKDAWDTVTDPNFWKAVGDLLADVAMVIGVLAMFSFPGLGLIGLLVAGGALAAHLGAMIGGADGVTWQTLAWDAAGLFAGARAFKGLKSARAGEHLIEAGSELKALGRLNVKTGRALRAGHGFKASLGKAGSNIFKQSPWKNLKGVGDGMKNSMQGYRQANTGFRQISQGERQVSAGREMVAQGKMLDKRWTRTGVGLAGGSNINPDRWADGDWSMADIPVIGTAPPLLHYDYGHHESPPQAMESGSSTFANGLNISSARGAA